MKKITYIICILFTISCTGFEDAYEYHFSNNTSRILHFKFYNLDGSGQSLFFDLYPHKDTIPVRDLSLYAIGYDSLYLLFDSTKFETFNILDTTTNRNVFKQRQGDYTLEIIKHRKTDTYKYTYTISEQDYIKADSI